MLTTQEQTVHLYNRLKECDDRMIAAYAALKANRDELRKLLIDIKNGVYDDIRMDIVESIRVQAISDLADTIMVIGS